MKITKITATVVDERGETHTVTIERCYGSFEQYGASQKVLGHTVDLAEAVVPFLEESEDEY